jgi:hypothetical protein
MVATMMAVSMMAGLGLRRDCLSPISRGLGVGGSLLDFGSCGLSGIRGLLCATRGALGTRRRLIRLSGCIGRALSRVWARRTPSHQ